MTGRRSSSCATSRAATRIVVLGPVEFVAQQILIMNPATFPLWLAGLGWLLGSRYRLLGIGWLVTLVIFIVLHGKRLLFCAFLSDALRRGWGRV